MLPHRVPEPRPITQPLDAREAPPATRPLRRDETAGTRPLRAVETAPAIRPLRDGEVDALERVFAGLSDQSRYQRFHGPKPRLTASDRAYLAAVDDTDHLAVVAEAPDGAPLGLARCVRVPGDRNTAELAAEVVDPWQRRGIGTEMVRRLARRAAATGIERLSATVLAETGLQRALLRRGWRVAEVSGPAVTLEASVWTLLTAA